jgi:hypothetical protein
VSRPTTWKSGVRRKPNRDAWIIAWALTLALHAGGILGFHGFSLLAPAAVAVRKPEPIRLVFKPSAPATRKPEPPQFFSELPPDRADAAPKKPDFLSNVTSRARDRVPGGDAGLPHMEGEADAPTVKLEPGGNPATAPSPPAPQPTQPPSPRSPETQPQSGAQAQSQPATTDGAAASPKPREPEAPRPASSEAPRGTITAAGNSDIHQPEMDRPHGNAELTGDVSLNTIAWDYAPWLQRFSRKLMHQWVAPPAYYMGILKEGGWAVVELEISKSGEVLRQELLEEQGHPSLIGAAQGALRGMAPMEALPADFPEPTLILRVRMVYPKVRSR